MITFLNFFSFFASLILNLEFLLVLFLFFIDAMITQEMRLALSLLGFFFWCFTTTQFMSGCCLWYRTPTHRSQNSHTNCPIVRNSSFFFNLKKGKRKKWLSFSLFIMIKVYLLSLPGERQCLTILSFFPISFSFLNLIVTPACHNTFNLIVIFLTYLLLFYHWGQSSVG